MNHLLGFILLLTVQLPLFSQTFQRNANFPVKLEDYFIAMPWAGGINDGQFSSIDVNLDGWEDLFVFDRVGNRKLVFIQSSDVQGQSYYYHAPQYQSAFPDGLANWVLLRDFNCDGLKDIFTNYQSGMVLYENTTDETGYLSFAPFNDLQLISANYDLGGGSFNAPLYCMSVDIPAIDDLDGDGDWDIVTNTESSTSMYFYKSMQIENGDCSIPSFVCANRCFGMVSEASESFNLFIGDQFNCVLNVAEPRGQWRHTGGTILTLDLDDNGIHDVLIGDVTETEMGAIYLVDTPMGPDSAVAVEYDYPQGQSINVHLFPAAFYEDVSNDGVKDLLVSPNALFGGNDQNSVALYLNQGTNDAPQWSFAATDFLQGEMIDVGVGAHPVAADIDDDGDQDIFIAARWYDTEQLSYRSQIHFLSNEVDDNGERYFFWQSTDWSNLSALNYQNLYPTFGDWDADEDWDLIIGELNGNLYAVENIGSAQQFIPGNALLLSDVNGLSIDVGQSATPQLVDINLDGVLDLVVGEKNGNVNYYKNVGSASAPAWSLVTDTLAGAMASSYLGLDGYSVPFVQQSENGLWDLYLGNEKGVINHYQFLGLSPQSGTLVEEQWLAIKEGDRSSVFFTDLTQDGTMDLLYGHSGGGLAIYTGDSVVIDMHELDRDASWAVFPNPGANEMHLLLGEEKGKITVFDVAGKCIDSFYVHQNHTTLNAEKWSAGVYFVEWECRGVRSTKRWVKW
jgi:hypothetical protein